MARTPRRIPEIPNTNKAGATEARLRPGEAVAILMRALENPVDEPWMEPAGRAEFSYRSPESFGEGPSVRMADPEVRRLALGLPEVKQ